MRIPLVNLPEEHRPYQAELDRGIGRVVASGGYIGGEEVRAFEEELAYYLGLAPWSVISCGNGSDALLLALAALELPRGGEVIIATHNYVAAAEAVCHLGLRPVWADVMPSLSSDGLVTFQMNGSPDYLESLLTPRTVALIAVNMYGMPCPAVELAHFCELHQIPWIEDNAQGMGGVGEIASGTSGATAPLGTRATIGTTSFFPTKPLGCMGDGGAAFVPHDQQLAERLRQLANHGQRTKYRHEAIGCNSRLDTLQAAILRRKLPHLAEYGERRRDLAHRYTKALQGIEDIIPPQEMPYTTHVYHQYTLRILKGKRDQLRQYLSEQGIPSMVYYPQPLHHQPAFAPLVRCPQPLTTAEQLPLEVLSLPIYPEFPLEEQDRVIAAIRKFA